VSGNEARDVAAQDVVIGVDMGTTATKVVAYRRDGELIARWQRGYPLDEPQPGHAVQDPRLILAAVLTGVAAVSAEIGHDRVAGLSFSTAMHSLMGLDAELRPITPVITWADTRATAQAERIRAAEGGLALHRRTGTPVHPMSPLTKLVWIREQDPDLHARAAHWVGIKDWVQLHLTGTLVTDHSVASASGLMDIHRLAWDPEALALAGIDEAQLPELVPTTTVLPGLTIEATAATGLAATTPVIVGAGDGPLANLGVGAVRPGVAACSIGTSGALRVAVERPAVDPAGGVFCYALTEDRWVVGGAINNGGVALEWLRGEIAADTPTATLLDEAATVPVGAGGLLMLPHLLGERAPRWAGGARGAYVGLTRAHHRGHLVRAAVEGVAMQLALVLGAMRGAGFDIHEIRATGGVMQHPLWPATLAAAFGTPLALLDDGEGSGFGAALLGMKALGLIDSLDAAAELVEIRARLDPDPASAQTYAVLIPLFGGLADTLAPANRALRDLKLPLA